MVVINYYNPCKRLELNKPKEVEGQSRNNGVWCGDLNAHNTLWRSERVDYNGQVIEEMLDEKNLVCLNDGSKTRIDVNTGRESVLDLTLVSSSMAKMSDWSVYHQGTIGSDHYPILCKVNISVTVTVGSRGGRRMFEKADWEKFRKESDRYLSKIDDDLNIETLDNQVKKGIISAARADRGYS